MNRAGDATKRLVNDFEAAASRLQIDEARLAQMDASAKRREAEERRKAETELRIHLVECGCPAKNLRQVLDEFETLDPLPSLQLARASFERNETILVISGSRGIGKTTAAAWWLVQHREPVPYVQTSAPLFVEVGLLARYDRYNKAEMRSLNRARALVIDDLGWEYVDSKGAFASLFSEVINARYAAELPTLITTQLPAEDNPKTKQKGFKSRYGERVADRIREVGRFVELKGESLRTGRR